MMMMVEVLDAVSVVVYLFGDHSSKRDRGAVEGRGGVVRQKPLETKKGRLNYARVVTTTNDRAAIITQQQLSSRIEKAQADCVIIQFSPGPCALYGWSYQRFAEFSGRTVKKELPKYIEVAAFCKESHE